MRARTASHIYQETRRYTDRYGFSVGIWVRPAIRSGLDGRDLELVMQTIARSRAEAPRAVINDMAGKALRLALVAEARRYLGVPYVWGGASPSGFDCSGLVLYVFAKFGVQLGHGATMQAAAGEPTTTLAPGDLIFFGGPGYYHHVGIYAGDGEYIHAPHSGTVVQIGKLAGSGWTLACRYAIGGSR